LIVAVEQKAKDDEEKFDWGSVDFITDRNNLRKLLGWARGSKKSFRIDLQLAGTSTVLMTRWEQQTTHWTTGSSYGFNFETASTRAYQGLEHNSTHHRVIQYDMMGLGMVVRYEVDGCMPEETLKDPRPSDLEALTDRLSTMKLGKPLLTSPQSLDVMEGGAQIPNSSVLELCTKSSGTGRVDWTDKYTQLFFSQTPLHIMAYHDRGTFTRVAREELTSPHLQEVNERLQPGLKKLRRLLETIRNIVIQHGERGRLSLVCEDMELKVFRRINKDGCLPDEYLKRFE